MSYATWNPVVNYVVGDVILYNAIAYQAIANSTNQLPPTSPAFWVLFTGSGGGGGGGGFFTPQYNSFFSNTTQNLVAGVELPITYDVASYVGTGVSLIGVAPTSQFRVSTSGVYRIVYSAQIDKNGGGGADDVDLYLRINGTNVANTGSRSAVPNGTEVLQTVSLIVSLTTTDVVEVIAYTAVGVNDRLLAVPAAPPVPAIPSIITDVQRIA
jgi:hypothetical protein